MKQRKSLIILIFILSFFITVGCDAKVDKTVNEKPYTTADDLDSNKKLEKNSQQKDKVKEDTPNLISGKKTTNDSKNNDIPKYNGELYVYLNDNEPNFTKDELVAKSYEHYSPLDSLGRVGVANAVIGIDIMPNDRRGNIADVKPSGWKQKKYDFIKTKDLYNRSHLIAYQLAAENANPKNLMTGTRQLNQVGMTIFERQVASYVKNTGNHVRYRVTPIFVGKELVARGVQMEARSIEDNGNAIKFNVYIFNVQPGVEINYLTGDSKANGQNHETSNMPKKHKNYQPYLEKEHKSNQSNTPSTVIKNNQDIKTINNSNSNVSIIIHGNVKSKIYHMPGQRDYDKIKPANLIIFHSESEAIAAGYRKAKR